MFHFFINRILPPGADFADPQMRSAVGKRSGAIGLAANLLLFAGKLACGLAAGSVSIVADAMNNLSDASSSLVTLIGFRLAGKPADKHHPYGHARYEYLSGLAVALLILLIGFELAKSSVEKILLPTETLFTPSLVMILAGSIVIKLGLFLLNARLGSVIGSNTLLAAAADSRNDCLTTGAVLLSAAIGHYSGVPIDGWAGLGVALFILWSGWGMARQTISPLLGENASPELQKQIIDALRENEKILGWHDLMVHDYGPGQRFASVHVEMDMKEDPLACHTIIDAIERQCLERHRVHLVIHYDPVVTDDEETNQMRREVELVLRSMDEGITIHDFRLDREADCTGLIFDMILPPALTGKEEQVTRMLETAVNLRSKVRYRTRITFDSPGFNSTELWENEEKF